MTARKQTNLNAFLSKRPRGEKIQSPQRGGTITATGSREVGTTLLKVGSSSNSGSKIVYSLRGVWITRRVTITHREFKELQSFEGTSLKSSHS